MEKKKLVFVSKNPMRNSQTFTQPVESLYPPAPKTALEPIVAKSKTAEQEVSESICRACDQFNQIQTKCKYNDCGCRYVPQRITPWKNLPRCPQGKW